MRGILLGLCLVIASLHLAVTYADAPIRKTFEQSYLQLENKLEIMKQKGLKISAETKKEMDDLLVQMNHEHTELKRQLDEKTQALHQNAQARQNKIQTELQEDIPQRLKRAFSQLGTGLERAWSELNTESKSEKKIETKTETKTETDEDRL